MIFDTPKLSPQVLELIDKYQDISIKNYHPKFDTCFLCFNPFLKTKNNFKINQDNYPSKNQIIENFQVLTWSNFIRITSIKDIKSLDRILGFYHTAIEKADKLEYEKFKSYINKNESNLIPADVDNINPIIEYKILNYLKANNKAELYIYSDIDEKTTLSKTEHLLNDLENFPFQPRITDKESSFLIQQDFDARFFYIYSDEKFVADIVNSLDLEGFYCDEITPTFWSKDDTEIKESIDWSEI